jgi:hypothetical protein
MRSIPMESDTVVIIIKQYSDRSVEIYEGNLAPITRSKPYALKEISDPPLTLHTNDGNSYRPDCARGEIVRTDPHGTSTIVVSGLESLHGLEMDLDGTFYALTGDIYSPIKIPLPGKPQ